MYEFQAHPDLLQAFQNAAVAGSSGNAGPSGNKSFNGAVVGENFPRSRGFDERAAKAAAEVRKKAAAKGLLVRRAGPAQASPSPSQLLNIINSGAVNEATTEGGKEEPSNQIPNGVQVPDGEESKLGEQTPVGLGSGLAAVNAKKSKTKPKTTKASTAESSN